MQDLVHPASIKAVVDHAVHGQHVVADRVTQFRGISLDLAVHRLGHVGGVLTLLVDRVRRGLHELVVDSVCGRLPVEVSEEQLLVCFLGEVLVGGDLVDFVNAELVLVDGRVVY